MDWIDEIKWDAQGLVPVIAQEAGSKDVLMFAFMNRESLALTVERGEAVYWSRSRARLWHKGEESGNVQKVRGIRLDCDADVILLEVEQLGHEPGIACHTGRHSCFYRQLDGAGDGAQWKTTDPVLLDPKQMYAKGDAHAAPAAAKSPTGNDTLARLADVIDSRRQGDPDKSYVARLFSKGADAIMKKVGEEATETVMAGKDGESTKLVYEVADLWFHSMLLLAWFGLRPADVLQELERREGLSGLEEFAARKAVNRDVDEAAAHAPAPTEKEMR